MKRKLWIMLALAALMALLWCGSAGADSPNYVFNQQPFGRTLAPGGSYTCYWETNFKPIKVDVCFGTSLSPVVVKTYGELVCEKRMNHVFKYDDGGGIYYIRAYYSGIGSPYVDSTLFVVETIPRGFEISPTGGNVSPSNALTLSWKTNFNPFKVEIGHRPSGGTSFVSDVNITTGLDYKMSYTLNYDDAYESNDCVLRAYYWNENQIEYVDSDNFTIQRVNEYSCGDSLTAILQNGVLTISGTGAMTDYNNASSVPWYSYRDSITSVSISSGVASIGDYAFWGCTGLTGVTIPDSVTGIGNLAFSDCSGLTSVIIPTSVTSIDYLAFKDCSGLTSVTVLNPGCVIGDDDHDVFQGCNTPVLKGWPGSTAETYASFTNSVTFESLGSLTGSCGTNVTYSFDPATGTLTISGTGAMAKYTFSSFAPWYEFREYITSVTIENGVTQISNLAFGYCAEMTSIAIASSVTSIGSSAFLGCHALTDLALPDSVSSIGTDAFAYCNSVTSLEFPQSLTQIGPNAFAYLRGLTSVNIPERITTISGYAFTSCTNLVSVTITNPNTVIESEAFDISPSQDLTFYGWTPSTAETYANDNNIPFVSLGSLTGSCGDNVTYSFDPATGTLTISGAGEMWDYDTEFSTSPWSGNSVASVTVQNGVTRIGAGAFYGCAGLTSITIPGSVAEIGDQAFGYCTALTSVTIPEGVTTICRYAFEGCAGLTRMTMPSTVTTIQYRAFRLCSGLTDVTINNFNAIIGDSSHDVFEGCPSSLTLHGWPGSTAETYANAAGIPFVSLGDISGSCGENVTWAFNPATGELTISGTGAMTDDGNSLGPWYSYSDEILSVTIEDGVTSISGLAFYQCFNLTSVTIPTSVTSIGHNAFDSCTCLTGITIPNSVTRLGDAVFATCTSLVSVAIPNSVTSIRETFNNCTGLTSVTIPNSVTSIGMNTFYSCTGLTSVTIPNSVTSIGSNAFNGCSGLTSVTIPNSVTRINDHAFYGCTGLTSVTIPDSVTAIGYSAFYGCSSLESATILNPGCVIGGSGYDVFWNCAAGFTLYGYAGTTAQAYAANTQNPCGFEPLAPAPDFFLPADLTSIESEAFSGIAAQAVVIPKNIQSISPNAFADSDVLYIYGFPGTVAETLAQKYPAQFTFLPLTDAWYARLTD